MGSAVSLKAGGFLTLDAINFVFYKLPQVWNNDGALLFNELSTEAGRHGFTLSLSGITTFTPKLFAETDIVTDVDWDNARQMVDTIMQELNTMVNDFETIDNTYHVAASPDTTYHVFYGIQNLTIAQNDTANDPDIASEEIVGKIIRKAYFILRLMAYFWDVFDETVQRRHSANLQTMAYLKKFSTLATITRTSSVGSVGRHIAGERYSAAVGTNKVTIYDLARKKKEFVVYIGDPAQDALKEAEKVFSSNSGHAVRDIRFVGANKSGTEYLLVWAGTIALQTSAGYWSQAAEFVVVDRVNRARVIERNIYFTVVVTPSVGDAYIYAAPIDGVVSFNGNNISLALVVNYSMDEQNGSNTERVDTLHISIDPSSGTLSFTRDLQLYLNDTPASGGFNTSRVKGVNAFSSEVGSANQQDCLLATIDTQGTFSRKYGVSTTTGSTFYDTWYNSVVGVEREESSFEENAILFTLYDPYNNIAQIDYVSNNNTRVSYGTKITGCYGLTFKITQYNGTSWSDTFHNKYADGVGISTLSKTYTTNRVYLTKPSYGNSSVYSSQYGEVFFALSKLPFTGAIVDKITAFTPTSSMKLLFIPPLIGSHYRHYEDNTKFSVESRGVKEIGYTQGLPIFNLVAGETYNISVEYDIPITPTYDRFNLWYTIL